MPIVDPTGGMLTNTAGNILSAGFLAAASGVKNFVSESFDDDLAKFERKANRLKVLRDVNEELIRQNGTKTSSSCYQQWLSNVNDTLRRVEELKSELKQLSRGLFSNSGNRSDLFERVQQTYRDIKVLLQTGEFQDHFLEDKPPKRVIKMNPPAIKMYPTLENHLQEILQLLSCDKVKTAGILGPFGVGKTTIMQHLNDCDQVAKLFDIVIWLKVSVPNKEKLQKQIARRLKVTWQDALHPDEIAESISEKLKDKKFLLLLDIDVKSRIDLRGIGIPDDIINGGSKVVFTTDFSRVHRSMADRVINVSALSADEAWLMFQQIVSSSDTLDGPGVKSVARLVAKECCGLPFLINQVVSSFKWKVYSDEWRNGLEELRNWSKVDIPGLGDMHAFIKFCYDDLNDEQKQRCFLYGALHPVDTKISTDYLVKCWAAERFLGSIDDQRSFRTACDKGYAILRGLTDVSLLQPGRRFGHVQVNNVVRQVALHISSEEESGCRFLVGKTRTSDVNGWGLAKRVFMIDTKLDHLPNPPSCCELLSLLLHKNPDLKTIPPPFFETMKMLLVLNLYRTGIETLPQSFECLNELKALFLNQCSSLTDLPLRTEKLSVLEVLDIRGSKVIFIPSAIGGLVSLRCLRVSYYKLRNVSPEERETDGSVISRLSKLEELVIDVMSYDQWRIEAVHLIRHVASLDNLTCLKIHFPKLEDLQTLLESRREWKSRENLSLLWASIGRPGPGTPEISSYLEGKIERYLRYYPEGHGDHSITANIFPETDAMELIGHNGITCLSQFMQVPGLVEVRDVLVVGCNNMVTLVDDNVVGGTNIQPKLHTIVVKSCPALTVGLIKHLATLKKLVINGCCSIEELFASSGVGSVQNLEVLELIDLPKLRAISEDASFECPQLKELVVGGCPELKKLPFNKQNAARLKLIEGEQHWWDALQWDDEIKQHFQPTFKLG